MARRPVENGNCGLPSRAETKFLTCRPSAKRQLASPRLRPTPNTVPKFRSLESYVVSRLTSPGVERHSRRRRRRRRTASRRSTCRTDGLPAGTRHPPLPSPPAPVQRPATHGPGRQPTASRRDAPARRFVCRPLRRQLEKNVFDRALKSDRPRQHPC